MPLLKPGLIRLILLAAGVYNLAWLVALNLLSYESIQELGMLMIPDPAWPTILSLAVGLLGCMYWWAMRDPERYFLFIFLGLVTKVIGVLIATTGVGLQNLPASALLTALFNDLIWIPLFALILSTLYRQMLQRSIKLPVSSKH